MGYFVNNRSIISKFSLMKEEVLYIDKSDVIEKVEVLKKSLIQRYFCISRPRRFGKTTILQMLSAYYCKKSSALKEDFKYVDDDFKQYNVININMVIENKDFDSWLNDLISDLKIELLDTFDKYTGRLSLNSSLDNIICTIEDKSDGEERFIVLIDEWDYAIRNYDLSKSEERSLLEFYNTFTKGFCNIELCIMFGVFPKSGYVRESLSNNVIDYAIYNDKVFSEYIGFTEDEVRDLLNRVDSNLSLDDIKTWYNGYDVNGVSVMNSNSIVRAIMNNSIGSYWENTGDSENLLKYYFRRGNDWSSLIYGVDLEISDSNPIKISEFESKSSLEMRLVYSGFLSFSGNMIRIPNNEILSIFMKCNSMISNTGDLMKLLSLSRKAMDYLLKFDEDNLGKLFRQLHGHLVNSLEYNNHIALSYLTIFVFIACRDEFHIMKELNSGEGFCDLVFMKKDSSLGIIIELKIDEFPDNAIQQIIDRNYVSRLSGFSKILMAGISYLKNDKEHKCKILEYDNSTKDCLFDKSNLF